MHVHDFLALHKWHAFLRLKIFRLAYAGHWFYGWYQLSYLVRKDSSDDWLVIIYF